LGFAGEVVVEELGFAFESFEGVVAEGGEEVAVEGLSVAVEGGLFEVAAG
jgi:hypothetical protein